MSFKNIISLDELLAPISDNTPTGVNIRTDRSPNSDYYVIKDARNNARAAERSSLFDDDTDLIGPWRTVVEIAPKILKNKSKDLEIACWYTEGLIRLHGFAGLRDGIKLIHQLVDKFWEGLYPEPDEDGLESKVAPLTGLNGDGGEGALLSPIRNAPVTGDSSLGTFNFWQYQKARDTAKITDDDERGSRTEDQGFDLSQFESVVQENTADFYIELIDTLENCLDEYKALNSKLRELCSDNAPPHSKISNLLEELLRTVRFFSKEKLKLAMEQQQSKAMEEVIETEEPLNTAEPSDQAPSTHHTISGPINSREQALQRLQEAADYFRRFEPHTPLAPGIERLINWGRMTVAELMIELLPDDQAKGFYAQLTGVKLDGSDTEKYVAPPPKPTTAPKPAENTTTKPKASTKPADKEKVAGGW